MRYLLALAVLALVLAACGGKAKQSPQAGSPDAGTAAASPTPTPEAPHAAELAFEAGVEELYQDDTEIVIGSGVAYGFDDLALAGKRGVKTPSCPSFVFLLSWQVRQPYPPEDVTLRIETISAGKVTEVASGTSGSERFGCAYVQLVNASDVEVAVEMRYGFGDREG